MNPVFDIGLTHYLLVSILLVAAGVATMLTKRNPIGILIGVELVLNAAAVNFVAFNRYVWHTPIFGNADSPMIDGLMFAIFVVVLAAAEAAVALAIFLNFYNNFNTIDVEKAGQLQG